MNNYLGFLMKTLKLGLQELILKTSWNTTRYFLHYIKHQPVELQQEIMCSQKKHVMKIIFS